jgi:hypothetical protein
VIQNIKDPSIAGIAVANPNFSNFQGGVVVLSNSNPTIHQDT